LWFFLSFAELRQCSARTRALLSGGSRGGDRRSRRVSALRRAGCGGGGRAAPDARAIGRRSSRPLRPEERDTGGGAPDSSSEGGKCVGAPLRSRRRAPRGWAFLPSQAPPCVSRSLRARCSDGQSHQRGGDRGAPSGTSHRSYGAPTAIAPGNAGETRFSGRGDAGQVAETRPGFSETASRPKHPCGVRDSHRLLRPSDEPAVAGAREAAPQRLMRDHQAAGTRACGTLRIAIGC